METLRSNTAFPVPAYIPQLDGLRGISILAVFVAHSEFIKALPHAHLLEYGRVGVDLFFVLSGFLITGILIDSRDTPHYFRNFYIRRALRIWPLYYVVLTFILLLTSLLPNSGNQPAGHIWPYFYLYIQNLFPHLTTPYGLEPTWSLAIEEQFYMTWPLLVLLLKRRSLAILLVCFIFLSVTLRIIGYEHDASLKFIHAFTFCRLDAISMGSLAAIWFRSGASTTTLWRRQSHLCILIGLIGVVLARVLFHQESTVVSYAFIAIGFAGILGSALASSTDASLTGRLLSVSSLRYIGRISYGLYLTHMPLFLIVTDIMHSRRIGIGSPILSNMFGAVVQFIIVFAVASLSWQLLETPILRLKSYFPSGSSFHWPTQQKPPTQDSDVPRS